MQQIRSEDTAPELIIMKELKGRRLHFTKHERKIFGKPDIVFKRKKVAVFVDSDFWHGHPSRCIMPSTNADYWKNKIESNRKRDRQVNRKLRKEGWIVIRIWEYDVKKRTERCVNRIIRALGMH